MTDDYVPCFRCQTPIPRDRAVRHEDGELYHISCAVGAER